MPFLSQRYQSDSWQHCVDPTQHRGKQSIRISFIDAREAKRSALAHRHLLRVSQKRTNSAIYQLSALRSAIEVRDEDDGLPAYVSPDHSPTRNVAPRSSLTLRPDEDAPIAPMSDEQLSMVLSAYAVHVDPVVKILHLPTFKAALETKAHYLGQPHDSSSFVALRSTLVYATVCSLSRTQYIQIFGSEGSSMSQQQWQAASEYWIHQAGIYDSHNIVMLQALILFVVS